MPDVIGHHIEGILPGLVAFRRDLHAHPELSRQEVSTSAKVREAVGRLMNVEVLPPLSGTDVVAVLNPGREGPCFALRADMDALPIEEQTGVAYRSRSPGVMHACGHDGHTTVLVGAARVLASMAEAVPGKVKFIFQPDEEDQGGGGVLCEKGVLESPKVDAIVALHAWPSRPVGTIAVRRGPAMAANTTIDIVIRGKGGHGAYPHRTVDPIVTAAHVVTALQTIVGRNVDPADAAVVTIGHISAGVARNVIPSECQMKGTIRFTRPEVGELASRRVREIVEHTARAHGAEAEVRLSPGYPPMINDETLSELVEETVRDVLGADRLITTEPVSMGVEDFAFYAQRVPAVMFRLGMRPAEAEAYPALHSPLFNFNDDALGVGVRMFCEVTLRYLNAAARGDRRSP